MQAPLRDQHPPLRCSRCLRELHRRGQNPCSSQCLHQQCRPSTQGTGAALGCQPEALAGGLRPPLGTAAAAASNAPVGPRGGILSGLATCLEARKTPHPCRPRQARLKSPCCEPENPQDWLRPAAGPPRPRPSPTAEADGCCGASCAELGEGPGLKARGPRSRLRRWWPAAARNSGAELGESCSAPKTSCRARRSDRAGLGQQAGPGDRQ